MTALARTKRLARILQYGRPYRRGHAPLLLHQVLDRDRNARAGYDDRAHLLAAAEWLARAQDVTGDGGVCGRYSLHRGWTSSYPETTGYILPTFLRLADTLDAPAYRERARQCLDFLLPLQLDSGAFPGMEIAMNRTQPSPFNTAQIVHGLVAWHRASGDARALDAARRAGDWLLAIQDDDGAFRRHFYMGVTTTYSAHASCWLAELGDAAGEPRYRAAAERHLDWLLAQRDEHTGWFDYCGFDPEQHDARTAMTHTVAYTLWGVLETAERLQRADGIAAVRAAADAIARRRELSGRLPGMLDHRWRGRGRFTCLTGNAQMALIWMRLHGRSPEPRLLNAAFKAIDDVKAAQDMTSSNPAIRGGVAGSDPVWGDYIPHALPNWAAKYFVDALIEKRAVLARERAVMATGTWQLPGDVPDALPDGRAGTREARPRIVLYTAEGSAKPAQMLRAWGGRGIEPVALVVERPPLRSVATRLAERLRRDGFRAIGQRLLRRGAPAEAEPGGGEAMAVDARTEAADRGIPVVEVASLRDQRGRAAVRALAPDVAVHAGAGILDRALLGIPRLGTLNAHMGLLPRYRGMNVAEWAALAGDPVGCSVYRVDPGIDTGDILCVRRVDPVEVRDIEALRARVDAAQLELLGEVLVHVLATGDLPPGRPQAAGEGVQFFRMHADLKALLGERLAGAGVVGAETGESVVAAC